MSINISKAIADISTGIDVHVDLRKLGPRQVKTYERAARTGVFKSWGLADQVAWGRRRYLAAPTVLRVQYEGIMWCWLSPDDEFWERLHAWLVAVRLHGPMTCAFNTAGMFDRDVKRIERMLATKPSVGQFYGVVYAKIPLEALSLDNLEFPVVADELVRPRGDVVTIHPPVEE